MSEIVMFSSTPSHDEAPLNEPIVEFDKLAAYYVWLGGVRTAEANVREKWAKNPGVNKSLIVPSYQPWEAPELSDEDRGRIYADIKLKQFYEKRDTFSVAAHRVVHSPDAARLLDDVKCDYMGDSEHLGWFREINSAANHTPFDVQFDYDIGRINHYTENGAIVHVRETSDPAAKSREQKLFIVVANLMTGDLKRLYADDRANLHTIPGLANSFNETIPLKTRHLSGLQGQADIDTSNDFALTYQTEMEKMVAQSQPKLRYQPDGITYKPEGYGVYELLRPIAQLDEDRYLLARLAFLAGQQMNERGAVIQAPARLSIAN